MKLNLIRAKSDRRKACRSTIIVMCLGLYLQGVPVRANEESEQDFVVSGKIPDDFTGGSSGAGAVMEKPRIESTISDRYRSSVTNAGSNDRSASKMPARDSASAMGGLRCKGERTQKNSGIFYTTILAKTAPYKRFSGFGDDASHYFFRDIDGDGKGDAVFCFDTGRWYIAKSNGKLFSRPVSFLNYAAATPALTALMGDVNGDGKADAVYFDSKQGNWLVGLSDGEAFGTPSLWAAGNGAGSHRQFLADMNGDGFEDAVLYFQTGFVGAWYVGLSDGAGAFGKFSEWVTEFGNDAGEHFLSDVNGDGKADAIAFEKSSGSWSVALSNGIGLIRQGVWKRGFGIGAEEGFAFDVDQDGNADIGYYLNGDWWVLYSCQSGFSGNKQLWLAGHRPATMVSRGNKPAPKAKLIGKLNTGEVVAAVISASEWLCLGNPDKSKTVTAAETDTWDAWGNPYTPTSGTYDAGNPQVLDAQIREIHDAGFTYIMLDITNGNHEWIDGRAKKLVERLEHWNSNLARGRHKMFFCLAMGSSRGLENADAVRRCEYESKRTWAEFYEPYKDAYYLQDGKPLLVHFVASPSNRTNILNEVQSMPFFRKFTARWMFNEVRDEAVYRNTYGWALLYKNANPVGDEVMAVSPGFWNGVGNLVDVAREGGDFYRSLWMRVLRYAPASVWVNSFNESWEHTSVEPARLDEAVAAATPNILQVWTDYYGERMDDFYWVMTRQYNRLFMYQQLFEGSFLQENGSGEIYVVRRDRLVAFGRQKPRKAPVLLVPDGYLVDFEGDVINENLAVVGKIIR